MKTVQKSISVGVVVAVVSLGVGYYFGKKAIISNESGRMGMQGSQMSGRGGFARGGANGNVVNGEVVSFDGGMLTVKGRDGGSRVVVVTSATKVSKPVVASSSDVKQGALVLITGTQNGDGSITAESVSIRDASQGFPGGR
jgi:hypothetical protein